MATEYLGSDSTKKIVSQLLLNDKKISSESASSMVRLKEDLTSSIKEKADSASLDIERKRIDSLTKNTGTSVDDVELQDIRIGIDGITYGTAGESVREQIKKINKISGTKKIEFIKEKNITLGSYSIGDTVDLTPSDVSGYRCAILDCEYGDVFSLNVSGGSNPRAFAFLDANDKLVEMANEYAKINSMITIPKGVRKIVINDNNSSEDSYYGVENISESINSYIPEISCFVKENGKFSNAKVDDLFYHLGSSQLRLVTGVSGGSVSTYSEKKWAGYGLYSLKDKNILMRKSEMNSPIIGGNVVKIVGKGSSNIASSVGDYYIDSYTGELKICVGNSGDGRYNTNVVPWSENTIYLIDNETYYYDFDKNGLVMFNNELIEFKQDVGASSYENWQMGKNIPLRSYNVGEKVSLTYENISNYRTQTIQCNPGETFTVSIYGGSNPRAFAFLDANNKLICKAEDEAAYVNKVLTAPVGAKKLIINDNRNKSGSKKGAVRKGKYIVSSVSEVETGKSNIIMNSDSNITSLVNGSYFANDINSHIVDLKKPTDKMVHVSTFTIINNVVYATYYANTRSDKENAYEHTARFCYCNLGNTSNITYIDLQDVGETFDGKTVQAVYDTILLRKDDNTLYLMWTAMLDNVYYRLYKTYDISTGTISSTAYNNFKMGSVSGNFSTTTMTNAFNTQGIFHKPFEGDIGIMQKLTSREENGTTYYYTGCYVGTFNCIIKSSDLVTWEFVSQPDFDNLSQWENACYVIGDYCYYSVRQLSTENSGFLTRYNLNTCMWDNPVYYSDCQSRPDFFEHGGELYMVHAPIDRNHISLMKVNQMCLSNSRDVQCATVSDCFYPYVDKYNGELYMSFTQSRQHIWLSKFRVGYKTEKDIIDAIKSLL